MFTFSSSFSPFDSTFVLCLIVASLITPIRSNYLSDVCIKSKSPKFCLRVFGPNPHRSPYELTQEAINLALRNAYAIANKIAMFYYETNDNNLKTIYNYCSDYYRNAINALRGAKENFRKDGLRYNSVYVAGNFAQKANFYCENEFQRIIGYVYASTLTKNNERMVNFGSIIVAAADVLSNSTLVEK
uniref:Pectinesterase inhibitor domain-containing protein n=1 Tax=Solanum lycopersicum TaxID=4081 RepID=A0A3Q7GNS0_SOLLC